MKTSWMTTLNTGLGLKPSLSRIGKACCLPVFLLLATASAVQAGDFTYTTNSGSITITGHTAPTGVLTIPLTTNGLPVTAIFPGAFANKTSLGKITIPASVVAIGDGAFGGCTGLAGVYFLGNAPTLGGANVFAGAIQATIYRLSPATGFGTVPATWGGRPTALWNPTFTLTVQSGTGSGSYTNQQQVTIVATAPVTEKTFDQWIGATQCVANVTSSTTTVTMPALAITLTATYKDKEAIPYYTLTVINGYGSGSYTNMRTVSITASNAPATKTFDCWIGDTQYVASVISSSTTVTMPTQAVTLTATYKDVLYTLTVNGGSGSGSYTNQQQVTITAEPPLAWQRFAGWIGDYQYVDNMGSSPATVTMPAQAVTLTAHYNDMFEYTTNADNTLTITDGRTSAFYNSGFVNIPRIINGRLVTGIGEDAFYCSVLSGITIPDSVTSIGQAFCFCTNLTSIIIPDSVTSIGANAFDSCTSLTSVTLPSGITAIADGTFDWCLRLGSITIPSNVTSIGNGAFYGSGLTSITIPNSVTSIGYGAFEFCHNLNVAIIGSGVNFIGTYAFVGDHLTSLYFLGNAPSAPVEIANNFTTIYRLSGATGWPTVPVKWPHTNACPTALWNPACLLTVHGGTGGGYYGSGQHVTITADAPASGQKFRQWTGDIAYIDDVRAFGFRSVKAG